MGNQAPERSSVPLSTAPSRAAQPTIMRDLFRPRVLISVAFQLLQIPFEVSTNLSHRVAPELLQRAPGQSERHHSFSRHSRGRHHTYIRTLIRSFYRLTSRKVH